MHANQRVLKKKKSPTKTIPKKNKNTARNDYNVNKKHTKKTRKRKTRNNDITKAGNKDNAHNVDKHEQTKEYKQKQETENNKQ